MVKYDSLFIEYISNKLRFRYVGELHAFGFNEEVLTLQMRACARS